MKKNRQSASMFLRAGARAVIAFSLLAPLASHAQGQAPSAPSAQVGFDTPMMLSNDHILIRASVNDQGPYLFLVDTGANQNILLSSLARQLGIQMVSSTSVNGFGSSQIAAQQTQAAPVTIGGIRQTAQSFLILDSALQVVKTAQPIQGVFGLPLFQDKVVFFDFAQGNAQVFSAQFPRSQWPSFVGQQTIPIKIADNGIALVPATINGVLGDLQLDTGSNAGLILYPQFVSAHLEAFPDQAAGAQIDNLQVGGSVQMTSIGSAKLTLADLTGDVGNVLVAATTPVSAVGKQIAGNIGVGVLKQFEVLIDYPDKTLTLTPLPLRPAAGTIQPLTRKSH